jgi:manganese/zinc/iron transport system ATP- binding protein
LNTVTSEPPSSPASPLEVHDLTVAYQKKPVLWGVDLVAPAGQLIGILGPNGAGKSRSSRPAWDCCPRAAAG